MKKLIVAVIVGVALGFVGAMDYADREAEAAYYCEMVKSGSWPDYQHTFKASCLNH